MEIKNLLPIGSIILLNEGKKRLMISGVKQTDPETDIDYDYIGVLYPEGHMGEVGSFLFNHADIQDVFFEGYRDEERDEFISKLDEFYKNA